MASLIRRIAAAGTVDLYAMMLASLACTLAYLGYIDQARSRLNEALSEARQLRHAQTLAEVLSIANTVDLITGSPEMQRHAEELLALSTEHGFPFFLAWATVLRGVSLTALGQGQEGLSQITRGIAGMRATGAVAGISGALMLLAWAYARLGQPVDGLNCLAEAAQIIETTDERQPEADVAFVARRFAECHRRSIRGRAELSSGTRGSEAAERKALGIAGIDQLGAPLVQTGQARRSP